MYFLIIYFIDAIYLLSAMVVAKNKFESNSTVYKQTTTIFKLNNPVYQKLKAEVSESFKLEDIITKEEDIYEDETSTLESSGSHMKSHTSKSSSTINEDLPPDNEILTEVPKSSWNDNDRIDTEKPTFHRKKKMNKFKPFSLGPELHINETVQIEKRQVDDDDHDDVSALEKMEDADDSGEIEFVEPKEALLDSLSDPANKSPNQEVSIPKEDTNNKDIGFVEKSADIERNIADIQEPIPKKTNELKSKEFNPDIVKDVELKKDSNEFKILYGNSVIEPTQPKNYPVPNAIESDTAESTITSKEVKTVTVIKLVTDATTIKEPVDIINDAKDVGNIMNLKMAETSTKGYKHFPGITRRHKWSKFNDSSWKANRYLKKALLDKVNQFKTSTVSINATAQDVNVKPFHSKKALFYAKVNKYTQSDDDDDDDDIKIRITKKDKHRHLEELYVEEDTTTLQESTKKDSYIMKLITNPDRHRVVTRTTEAVTVEDISEHHLALDKLINLERKYEEAITSTTVTPPVTKSSERKSKYSKKGLIYKHYEYTTPETNDNTELDTQVEVKPLKPPKPKDSKGDFFQNFPMKYTVSDDDEPTINQVKKTEDASDYLEYQQTVIIPNKTITYEQDYSNDEATSRYIIPNRTKSADHDFTNITNDETTTRYTRTFSKIIQDFDYQQTAIIPNRTITAGQDYSKDETTTRHIIPYRTKSVDHDFSKDENTTRYRTFSKVIQIIDHNETTVQPIVKPTRVRHKPSRPIHKYDTTTQMKWRSDFTKEKQDVLENSTIGYINTSTLKNHDFPKFKLNLSSYEREDQMKEEMFSTDRVVGRNRTKINLDHNETTLQPIAKPTRVRHKPSRPIHKYDTTTQMKWRTDFTKKKQDVPENSTIGYINTSTLKNHDFPIFKLNLSSYEREDQMKEEMFSTDRVVGRKRTKINSDHNETTLQPIVKPTRVRHKPLRPIHKYDTTTQMKWRSDFTKKKKDVLENSTIVYINTSTLKNLDFSKYKLNLSSYEREDQMIEEMFSTDRVVGRKMTKIDVDHNETTLQPIVKPTRVRHKPSRPIHKYDTTTQMKWRSDFIKPKQDVLENSTIGYINTSTLKNYDFSKYKLNLSVYEREDQMIEEMISTDRVVGRKRTNIVSVDAKQFSMPDSFANWKPEPKIENAVTKNKNYHSVSPHNRRKLTSPIVVPTRTTIADNIVTVTDRQTTTIHQETIEPDAVITETRKLIRPTRTRTKKMPKKKHHYALPRKKITITPIKIPNRTKTLEYYIIPNVTATSSMYPKPTFAKEIKSSQTNIVIPTRIRTKSVAKKFSQFLPSSSTTKTRKGTISTHYYTVPNRTKAMEDKHYREDESTSQLTRSFSKVINKKSHLLTSRLPTKARTTLQYAIIPNRTKPIIVDYSNEITTKYTKTFNFSRIPKKSHLLSVPRTKVSTSLQYAIVPNRTDPIIYYLNYNGDRSTVAEYTTRNLIKMTKKSSHQTSRTSTKAKSKTSLQYTLPSITRTAKKHYSNDNGEPTLYATKFSRIAKKLHRLTSRLTIKPKGTLKSSLQNNIFISRTLSIPDQHHSTEKITTSRRKTSKMSKYTLGPFIATKQTATITKQEHEIFPSITRTKEISSTDDKRRYLSTRLYDIYTKATLHPKRTRIKAKPYETSTVIQYETIPTKSTLAKPPTYITMTLTEDYRAREDVTSTEAFTEISEEYFNITYTIPTRTIGVIDQYTFIFKPTKSPIEPIFIPTKSPIVPQRTTGNLNKIKGRIGSKSHVRPTEIAVTKSHSNRHTLNTFTPTADHFIKRFGITRTRYHYQKASTRDILGHKYNIGPKRTTKLRQEFGPTRSTINAEYHYPTRSVIPQEYYSKIFGPTTSDPILLTKEKLYNGPTRTHMTEEDSILHKIFQSTRTYYHTDTSKSIAKSKSKSHYYHGYYTKPPTKKYKHPERHTFHDIPSKSSSSWTNMLAEYKTNPHGYRHREEKTEQEPKPNLAKEEDSDSGVQNPLLDKEENSNRGEQNPDVNKGDNSDDTDTGETPNLNKEEQKFITQPLEQEEYKATSVQPDKRANIFRLTRTTYKFTIVPSRTREQHFRIMEGGYRPVNKNIQLNLDSSEERAFLFDNRNSILANSDKKENKLKEIAVSFGKTEGIMDDLESIEDVKFEFENVTEAPADYVIGRVTQIVSEATTEEPDSYESLMKRINVLTPYPDAPGLQDTGLTGFHDEETPRNDPKPKFKIKVKLDPTNKDKAHEKEEISDVFPKYEEFLRQGPPAKPEPTEPQPTEPQTTETETETTEESSTESNETSTEPVPSDPCEIADNFLKKDLQNKTVLPVPFTRTGVAIGTKLLTFALVVLVLRQAT